MNNNVIEINSHVAERLNNEKVIWLTTVGSDGTPQPNPVWFYWNGSSFIIYTPPSSSKLKNIARNPKVSLNFEGAEILGGDVIVFTGEASVNHHCNKADQGYTNKYIADAAKWGRTPEDLIAEYSVEIRIMLSKIRINK
jgi:PPOX class probable F420-dependent enzyme, Rv3369 family